MIFAIELATAYLLGMCSMWALGMHLASRSNGKAHLQHWRRP